jgi:glycosyltransferase involved in cell wall biosynthesis
VRRLAIVSSYQEECGAAFYSSRLLKHLSNASFQVDVKRLPVTLLRVTASSAIRRKADREIARIANEIRDYDAVLLQFEPGLYGSQARYSYARVRRLLMAAKRAVVTVHGFHRGVVRPSYTDAIANVLTGKLQEALTEWKLRSHKTAQYASRFWRYVAQAQHVHVLTFCRADQILLQRLFDLPRITNYPITYFDQGEVAEIKASTNRGSLLRQFGLDPDKRYLGVFGFLSSYKGHLTAMKALEFLPDDWNLAIIGGEHPHAMEADREIGPYLGQMLAFLLLPEPRLSGFGSTTARINTDFGEVAHGIDLERMQIREELLPKSEFKYFLPNERIRKRIQFLGQVNDENMNRLYATLDYAVHPYIKTKSGQSASGPATMAIEFGTRALFSNAPVFREMDQYFPGAMAFFNVGNFVELAESLQRFHHIEDGLTLSRERALKHYNPSGMVEAYRNLLDT